MLHELLTCLLVLCFFLNVWGHVCLSALTWLIHISQQTIIDDFPQNTPRAFRTPLANKKRISVHVQVGVLDILSINNPEVTMLPEQKEITTYIAGQIGVKESEKRARECKNITIIINK